MHDHVCGVKEGEREGPGREREREKERERYIQLLVLVLYHEFSCELLELLYMHSIASIHSNMRATLL